MKSRFPWLLVILLATGFGWPVFRGGSRAESSGVVEAPVTVASPVLAAPATPTPDDDDEPSPQQLALQRALENGDLCEARRRMQDTDESEFYGAVLSSIKAGGDLLETYGENGPLLTTEIDPSRRFHGASARSAWALRVGGLITTPIPTSDATPAPDYAAARAQLLALEKKEPGNAFFPLFRLVAESRLGYSIEALKATAEAAAAGTYLDSHLQGIERELANASWTNPALFNALADFHAAAQPQWYDVTRVLHRLEKDGFGGNARIASMLAEEARSSELPAIDGGFDSLRYYAANDLDSARVPPYEELNRARGWNENRPWPLVIRDADGERTCAPEAYEAFFFEMHERR